MNILKTIFGDETYISFWRWLTEKTQGYRIVITVAITILMVYLATASTNVADWPDWSGVDGKTAWDLAGLLLIPFVLALGGYLVSAAQRKQDREIAEKEREADREIAKDREEERMLQSYFDGMTRLLLEENLRSSAEDDEVRSIARARTLAVLRGVNGSRKGSVINFLYEADLIDEQNI